MKNLILSFALVAVLVLAGVGVVGTPAFACSPMQDFTYPTTESVLQAGGDAFIIKTLATGTGVLGQVTKNLRGDTAQYSHVSMLAEGHSCSSVFSFEKDRYALIITPTDKKDFIYHNSLDEQFTYFFATVTEAEAKYKTIAEAATATPPTITPQPPVVVAPPVATPPTTCGLGSSYGPAGYTLRPGMKYHDAVKHFQQELNNTGLFKLTIDGSYGPATSKAVMEFQKIEKLYADGLAGAKTQARLEIARQHNCPTASGDLKDFKSTLVGVSNTAIVTATTDTETQ